MLVFSLSNGETEFQYKMPEHPKEISCSQIIDFQQKIESKKPDSLKQYEALKTKEEKDEFILSLEEGEVSRKWTGFYMREIMFWCNVPANVIGYIPVQSEDGNDLGGLRAVLSKAFKAEPDETKGSFKYKGKRYYMPAKPANIIDPTKTDFLRGATLGEFATATELYRAYSSMLDGSCLALLHVIAILCRRKGEELPSLPDEQNDFIKKRVEHLKDLDFNTAMNVGFFLTVRQPILRKRSAYLKAVAARRNLRRSTGTI